MLKRLSPKTTINLNDIISFDLSCFVNYKQANSSVKKEDKDYLDTYNEDLEKHFPHLLLFKNNQMTIFFEEVYGSDNNYSDYLYIDLNETEKQYVIANNLLVNFKKVYEI